MPTTGCDCAPTSSRRPSATAGAEDPETIVLRQQRGMRRARQVDTVEAALVGACDGELTVGQILDALAQLLERDRDELRHGVPPGGAGARRTRASWHPPEDPAPGMGVGQELDRRATVTAVAGHAQFRCRAREIRSQEKQWHTSW